MTRDAGDAFQVVHAIAERMHRTGGQSGQVDAARVDLRVLRQQAVEDRHGARLPNGRERRVLKRASLPLDRREDDGVCRGQFDPAAALPLNARIVHVAVQHDDERHRIRRGRGGCPHGGDENAAQNDRAEGSAAHRMAHGR